MSENIRRRSAIDYSVQFNMGDLLEEITMISQRYPEQFGRMRVFFDFLNFFPKEFCSWRGIYTELAICPVELYKEDGSAPTGHHFEGMLHDQFGKMYEGWKGGGPCEVKENTPIWVDRPGQTTYTALVGARPLIRPEMDTRYNAIILKTAKCEVP